MAKLLNHQPSMLSFSQQVNLPTNLPNAYPFLDKKDVAYWEVTKLVILAGWLARTAISNSELACSLNWRTNLNCFGSEPIVIQIVNVLKQAEHPTSGSVCHVHISKLFIWTNEQPVGKCELVLFISPTERLLYLASRPLSSLTQPIINN